MLCWIFSHVESNIDPIFTEGFKYTDISVKKCGFRVTSCKFYILKYEILMSISTNTMDGILTNHRSTMKCLFKLKFVFNLSVHSIINWWLFVRFWNNPYFALIIS